MNAITVHDAFIPQGCQRRRAARRHDRRRRALDRRVRRRHDERRPLRAGRRLQHRRRHRPPDRRRLRLLLEDLRHGRVEPPRGRGRDRRREDPDRQRLHEPRPLLGAEGRRRRHVRRRHEDHGRVARPARVRRRRGVRDPREVRRRDAPPDRLVPALLREVAHEPALGRVGEDRQGHARDRHGRRWASRTSRPWRPGSRSRISSRRRRPTTSGSTSSDGGATQARNWWDVDWRKKYTPDAMVWDPRDGAPKTNVWWKGDGVQASLFLYAIRVDVAAGGAAEGRRDRPPRPTRSSTRRASSRCSSTSTRAWRARRRTGIAASRDTATNPAVLDAFTLALIASGAPLTQPEPPGHEPTCATARDDAKPPIAAAARRAARSRPERRLVHERDQLLREVVPDVLLGPELPAPGAGQEEATTRTASSSCTTAWGARSGAGTVSSGFRRPSRSPVPFRRPRTP